MNRLDVWVYIFYASVLVFVITLFALAIGKFLKNRLNQPYTKDELIKTTKTQGAKNKLYFTHGETYRYIKKYVISSTRYDKYVVVNYNELYNKVSFSILCYKNSKTPFKILKYTEYQTLVNGSKIIIIPRKTKHINIIINQVNNIDINTNVTQLPSKRRITVYASLTALHIFSALFAAHYLIASQVVGGSLLYGYLHSFLNYGLVLLFFIISILSFIIARSTNVRKIRRVIKKEGAIEHDFA